MKEKRIKPESILKNTLITLFILLLSVAVSFLLKNILMTEEQITAVFVFAVFLVSMLTDGYAYGIAATLFGVLAVNYAFMLPYFAFNFTARKCIFSAIIMIIISTMTSTLTTRLKYWQELKAEGEREMMRANLLRAVSHDLRTPLTSIYGLSSAIIDNYGDISDEQRLKMISGIKDDSQWLIRMVENLLSVTRIDSGKVKIAKTPVVLDELIDSALIKFSKRYPAQEVRLSLPDNTVIVQIDPMLIEQVIINLLENAVQHATGMTELTLRVTEDDKKVTFEIQDNGIGIQEEIIKDILSGASHEVRQSDDKNKHAGIGLSVCATIIKAHGGTITAGNAKNGGAVFIFTLLTEEGTAHGKQQIQDFTH